MTGTHCSMYYVWINLSLRSRPSSMAVATILTTNLSRPLIQDSTAWSRHSLSVTGAIGLRSTSGGGFCLRQDKIPVGRSRATTSEAPDSWVCRQGMIRTHGKLVLRLSSRVSPLPPLPPLPPTLFGLWCGFGSHGRTTIFNPPSLLPKYHICPWCYTRMMSRSFLVYSSIYENVSLRNEESPLSCDLN